VIRADVKRGLLRRSTKEESILPLQSMTIRSEKPIRVFADGELMEGTRFDISVESMGMKIITGKERAFET
jgi:diacylglycerol kinase family enzyme